MIKRRCKLQKKKGAGKAVPLVDYLELYTTAGTHVCTCPIQPIMGLLKHPLTDIGLAKFAADAAKSK